MSIRAKILRMRWTCETLGKADLRWNSQNGLWLCKWLDTWCWLYQEKLSKRILQRKSWRINWHKNDHVLQAAELLLPWASNFGCNISPTHFLSHLWYLVSTEEFFSQKIHSWTKPNNTIISGKNFPSHTRFLTENYDFRLRRIFLRKIFPIKQLLRIFKKFLIRLLIISNKKLFKKYLKKILTRD